MKYSKINANNKIEFCISEAIRRLTDNQYKMGCYQYVAYFVKRQGLSINDSFYIREQIEKYIDNNISILFPVEFTINNKKV